MGKQQMPIGTIRHWQNGDVIKAHENNLLHSGWISLSTSQVLEEIGRDCDSKANLMMREKIPISGELFLDREINEFEKDEQGNHPFNPANFKQYEGFYGAGRYSFRNEFSKRFMADKIALAEAITNAMLEANEFFGGKNVGDNKKDVLTKEQKQEIRKKTELDFKYSGDKFKVEDASKLQGIVNRTYNQLKIGVNFDDIKQKETYADALLLAESFPVKYDRIVAKRASKEDMLESINEVFKDNWGVRESVRKLLEDKYGEYVRKFTKQISDDEAKDQEATFGVKLDDDMETFYKALFKKAKEDKEKVDSIDLSKYVDQEFKVKTSYGNKLTGHLAIGKDNKMIFATLREGYKASDLIENYSNAVYNTFNLDENNIKQQILEQINPSKYPFKELIYLRFETIYHKALVGDWNIDMLPVIYNIEKFMNTLPSGHFKTNKDVTVISNKDFGDKGYAFYSQDAREISFSNKAANAFQVWGALKGEQEFNCTCSHEIGHAVSKKFGRSGNLDYKKFVVGCGWDYQMLKLSGEHATGGDKDINRTGSNSMSKLLTEYSHKSPEEAFAEYYSIYATNREVIDRFLDTNDSHHLEQKSKMVVKERSAGDEKSVSHFYNVNAEAIDKDNTESTINNSNLDKKDHFKIELINPWQVAYSKEQHIHVNETENKKQGIRVARLNEVRPIIVVRDKLNHYVCIEDGHINEGMKFAKKFSPAIVISEEMYHHLKQKVSDAAIKGYAVSYLQHEKVPIQASLPVFKKGLEYRNDILDVKDLVANGERLRLMRHIFNSKSLEKALQELFSFDKIRSIFAKPTLITNEQGVEADILKAKISSLVADIEGYNKELVTIKNVIDASNTET